MNKPKIGKSDFIAEYLKVRPEQDNEWFTKNNMVVPCDCEDECRGWRVIPIGKIGMEAYLKTKPKDLIWDGDSEHWTTSNPDTDKNLYHIDIKVYHSASLFECPYWLPDHMIDYGHVKQGYHTLQFFMTEEENDKFYEWAFTQSWLKVIGETTINKL